MTRNDAVHTRALSHSQTRGGFSARATRLLTQFDTSGWTVGEVVVRAKPDDGCVHTRAVSTCTVVFACCACDTGARETQGVCARRSAVCCSRVRLVCGDSFCGGDVACGRTLRPVAAFRPGHALP